MSQSITRFSLLGIPAVIAVLFAAEAQSQGLLLSSETDRWHPLPRPTPQIPGEPAFLYDITRLEVDASIRNQVAEVQVSQTFKNRTSRVLQVKFVFPLPYDGAIDQMTFLVDGDELEGRLLEADEAREIYQSYVRRSRDPALVQWIGTGMFQTQVFPVPAGAERTVSLRYTQLCKRSGNLTDWSLPLAPARFTCRPIEKISIRGRIRSNRELGNVYSPSHDVRVDRSGDRRASFEYTAEAKVPDQDFRLLWDSGDEPVQLSVVAYRPDRDQDGYFMLMIQPRLPAPTRESRQAGKNVILVVDKSGSMRGDKIDQARQALHYVVKRLKPHDQFTLIDYDSNVEVFRPELTPADQPTIKDAQEYIDSLLPGGSTNIDEALREALRIAGDADGPAYVVFMTDGRPTVGERNAMKIADNAIGYLHPGTRLFSLGVGHDVNSRLLDKLATICLGQTLYVRPNDRIDEVVSNLYDRIGAPALTEAELQMTVDGKPGRTRQLYPAEMYDLFSGDQLVIVGRYRRAGELKIELTGDYLGESKRFVFRDELPEHTRGSSDAFVERLWATRRIGQIIDEIDLHGENRELTDELIILSKRHGILTPYTAFLAEERTDLNDLSAGRRVTQLGLEELEQESGGMAFRQRAFKGSLKSALRAATPATQDERIVDSFGGLPAPAGGADGLGAMNFEGAEMFGQRPAIAAGGSMRDAAQPAGKREPSVKLIGTKTFYRRGNRYIDADASKQQIAAAVRIVQFTERYFELLEQLGKDASPYFAEPSELLVVLDNTPYLITPAD